MKTTWTGHFFSYLKESIYLWKKIIQIIAHIVFDDRGAQHNRTISTSVSNFLHKSHAGQDFEKIIKAPSFAISHNNVGVQIADMVAFILGKRMTGHYRQVKEFDNKIKNLQFKSRKKVEVNGC